MAGGGWGLIECLKEKEEEEEEGGRADGVGRFVGRRRRRRQVGGHRMALAGRVCVLEMRRL